CRRTGARAPFPHYLVSGCYPGTGLVGGIMNGFGAALKAELYVLLRSNAARMLVLLPALIVVVRAVVVRLSETGQQARDALMGQDGPALTGNAWGHFVDSFSVGVTMLGLVLVAYAAWSFASERDSGAMRHV